VTSGVRRHAAVGIVALSCFASCRSGTVIAPGPENQRARGTLSGTVTGPDETLPVAGRLVEAVDVTTGARFSTTTDRAGGYSILLPAGTYRIEVALGRDEAVAKKPPLVEIGPGQVRTGIDVIFGGAGVVESPSPR
jgi:hypothetical protein